MSAWKDFVTAALLGTEKGMDPKLPGSLAAVLEATGGTDREQRFLTQAGAFGLWRKTGAKPAIRTEVLAPAEREELPLITSAAASHLRTMLNGTHKEMLPEWLATVVSVKKRVPPELLPALLEYSRKEPAIRDLAVAAGGQRADWLATHNPRWSFAAQGDPELWETGTRDQRLALLRAFRATAPAEARAKVEAVWKEEPADIRAAFLAQLAVQLSEEDIPFLEAALDDRSKEVRREVIDLLAQLPSSPFAVRMLERAKPLLTFKKGGLLARASLEVALPDAPDEAALRDGINPKEFGKQKEFGEKAAALVIILGAVPLSHWTRTFEQTPEALLKAVEKSEFAIAVATGWALAAMRQREAEWAAALLDGETELNPTFANAQALFAVLPNASRVERIRTALRTNAMQNGDVEAWQSLTAYLGTLTGEWPAPLAREIVATLRKIYDSGKVPWQVHGVLQLLPRSLPPSLLAEAATGWPDDQYGTSALVESITFRQAALLALSQS
ncbi:MAG: DUF5691 domain-containing protein [Chthoniobacteraceae bacterium]